jgi:hypothetical protein
MIHGIAAIKTFRLKVDGAMDSTEFLYPPGNARISKRMPCRHGAPEHM